MTTQLSCRDLRLTFGGVTALDGVSFDVAAGEIFAIIGPNGAGKSSMLNCISGLYRPQQGEIAFDGAAIKDLPPHQRAERGIARSFQNIALFRELSVIDNIMTGRHLRQRAGVLSGGFFLGKAKRDEEQHRAVVEEIIEALGLQDIRRSVVGSLPYGRQKRVELARALAMEPRLLLLDEPMAGMNTAERDDMVEFILEANCRRKITVMMIEHDMGMVMDISDTVCVLDFGKRIAIGTPDQVKNDPHVIKAYLGEDDGLF
jgi:branched-chain amino acid transport system ATP-binding protein